VTPHATYRALLARRAELSPDEERRLAEHLQGCSRCREVEREYSAQDEIFRALRYTAGPFSAARPPLSVEQRVMAEVQRYQPEPEHGTVVNALLIGLKRNGAALVAVVLLVLLFLIFTPGSPLPGLLHGITHP
jgi:anti-sigma factor RsiW